MGVATAATTMSSAPAQPMTVGMLNSGKIPGAQEPSIACWIVLSSPSRAAAKQQITRPRMSTIRLRRPQNWTLARVAAVTAINNSRTKVISVVAVDTAFPK